MRLKFVVLFFTFRKSRQHNFPLRAIGLAKKRKVAQFMDSEMYFLEKKILKIPFTNGGASYITGCL
jgi:hypothetical protein